MLSGEALLERFYCERAIAEETRVKWSQQLEDLMYEAAGKRALSQDIVPGTLTQRFWSGLWDQSIMGAFRHKHQDLSYEQVLTEARVVEEEKSTGQKEKKTKSHQVTEADNSKLDLILKKMEQLDADIKELKEVRSKAVHKKKKGPVKFTKCNVEDHLE